MKTGFFLLAMTLATTSAFAARVITVPVTQFEKRNYDDFGEGTLFLCNIINLSPTGANPQPIVVSYKDGTNAQESVVRPSTPFLTALSATLQTGEEVSVSWIKNYSGGATPVLPTVAGKAPSVI